MYYLNEIEFLKLRETLLEVYSYPIDENLRGWNWNKAPLRVPYSNIYLSAWEFSSFCPNYRDIYIRRKLNIRLPPSEYQVIGFLIHKVVQKIFSLSKREILIGNSENLYEVLQRKSHLLINNIFKENQQLIECLNQNFRDKIERLLYNIINFEIKKITTKVEEIKTTFPFINEESLAFKAIPINPELTIDGSLIGFSKILRVDAFGIYGNIVYDIKFGRPNERHKLQLTVYALSIEANFMVPINIGIVVYVNTDKDMKNFTIDKQIFIIDDYLRSKTIELRDEIMGILTKEKPPSLPEKCHKNCLLKEYCVKV